MNFVAAYTRNLAWKDLEPFVRSVRACAPSATLVLFLRDTPPETLVRLREAGVVLQPFDGCFPEGRARTQWLRNGLWRLLSAAAGLAPYPDFGARWLERAGGLLLRPNQARFFHYAAWIRDTTVDGDRILLCDARDTVFQGDPFHVMPATGAIVTLEEPGSTMASNQYNAKWYRETYGPAQLARQASRTPFCAGVIGGERASLLALLQRIMAESRRRPHLYGAEQAILNHLCFEQKIEAQALPNRGSLVWHLFGIKDAEVTIGAGDEIRDAAGYLYPIVHMYDRLPKTIEAVARRWRA